LIRAKSQKEGLENKTHPSLILSTAYREAPREERKAMGLECYEEEVSELERTQKLRALWGRERTLSSGGEKQRLLAVENSQCSRSDWELILTRQRNTSKKRGRYQTE